MRAQRGFTLVEVIVALVLLGTVVLALSGGTARMIHAATESGRDTILMSLVQERLGQIAADPAYAELEDQYQGTESGEMQGVEYRRTTLISHVRQNQSGGRVIDYKRVAVTVMETNSGREVTRAISVGAP